MNALEAKGFTGREYPKNLLTVSSDLSVTEAIDILRKYCVHHLSVTREGRTSGIVAEKDLLLASAGVNWFGSASEIKVGHVARECGPAIQENTDVRTALSLMLKSGATALPIEKDGRTVGIITETDMLGVLEELLKEHDKFRTAALKGEALLASPLTQNVLQLLGRAGI